MATNESSCFAALVRGGGTRFDRRRWARDIGLFATGSGAGAAAAAGAEAVTAPGALPKELRFFAADDEEEKAATAAAEPVVKKQRGKKKKQQKEEEQEEGSEGSEKQREKKQLEKEEGEEGVEEEEQIKVKEEEEETGEPASKKRRVKEGGLNLFTTTAEEEEADEEEEKDVKDEEGKQTHKDIAQIRRAHHIRVQGSEVPPPITSFAQLKEQYHFPAYLMRNIVKMHYPGPTPIQMQCIPPFAMGREVVAIAPTGSGKTAGFVLPILYRLRKPLSAQPSAPRGFRAVILSPTKELALQTYRVFQHFAEGRRFRVCVLSKVSGKLTDSRFDVLVSTPLRLVYMIKHEAITLSHVQILVLDEADKLFDDSFVEQVDEVIAACKGLIDQREQQMTAEKNKKKGKGDAEQRHENATKDEEAEKVTSLQSARPIQVCMFSATMLPQVEQLAASVMRDPVRVWVGAKNVPATSVAQQLMFVGSEQGKVIAMRTLLQEGLPPPVLVFVQSKERAQELFQELVYDNVNVEVIHSDRTQHQRDAIVDSFREGKIWVLIATDVIARGMDFKNVAVVINYDFPTSTVSYIHRIGRTGRAGKLGRAITFFTEDDAGLLRSVAAVMRDGGCQVPDWMLHVKSLSRKRRANMEKRPLWRDSILTPLSISARKAIEEDDQGAAAAQ
eukprot:TRINITY_DN7041_c0_g1_i1.p1 TRINITY_DN7041_c0_g1~~TRINITY_DN7041_c0_g1_i1.p1  ORF type:complete len:687 (+),score=223.05 TRINITY_DN7041_c0_g1_i1:47-2062(+)